MNLWRLQREAVHKMTKPFPLNSILLVSKKIRNSKKTAQHFRTWWKERTSRFQTVCASTDSLSFHSQRDHGCCSLTRSDVRNSMWAHRAVNFFSPSNQRSLLASWQQKTGTAYPEPVLSKLIGPLRDPRKTKRLFQNMRKSISIDS